MDKRYCITIVLCSVMLVSSAQILKTDRISVRTDTSKALIGSIDLSFDFQNRSNSPSDKQIYKGFDISSDLAFLSENTAFVLINQLNYLSVSGSSPLNIGYSHIRIIPLRKNALAPEVFSQAQYDQTRNMTFRFLQGAGLKWTPLDTEKTDLHLGSGLMWELERWVPDGESEVEKKLWKSSTYLGLNTSITDSFSIHLINYYQVGKDGNTWRNRLSGDIWLSFEINDRFAFNSKFSYQYEDAPIIPINKSIVSFTNGLGISF